ncbi:MAG: hypothetical protein GZ091_16295 [Paludibacter sp.]|nr:hypothetical protein [Paludibacter sp.]
MKKFLLIMIVLYTFLVSSFSQILNPINDYFTPSSNASNLGFYVMQGVNKCIGAPDVSIPIYSIEDGKLKVPLTLKYNSTGVKVNQQTGWVGMGWSLNCGGVITRDVKNIPDEWKNVIVPEINLTPFSFTWGADNATTNIHKSGFFYTGKYAKSDPDLIIRNKKYGDNKDYDLEPDIFYFNFGQYSGKFFCSNNTNDDGTSLTFYTVPNYNFKIECKFNNMNGEKNFIDQIFITTPEGTRYEFGSNCNLLTSSINALDQTAVEFSIPDLTSSTNAVSTAWYLKKITTTNNNNNNSVNLYYKSKDNQSKRYVAETLNPYYMTMTMEMTRSNLTFFQFLLMPFSMVPTNYPSYEDNGKETRSMVYSTYLSSIETEDELINFNFSNDNFLLNDPLNYPSNNNYNQKLNEIVIKNKISNKEVKKITFCYDDPSRRLCLRALNLIAASEVNSYKFYYKDQNKLPNKFTDCFDHWGYLINPATPCSKPVQNSLKGYNYLTTGTDYAKRRDIDLSCTGIGMLEIIEYPTGATTNYEYEQNTYNKYGTRSLSGTFIINDVQSNTFGYAGGVRVKQITENNGSGSIITKRYEYTGGVLSELPIYQFNINIGLPNPLRVISKIPIFKTGTTNGSDLGYSSVAEISSNGSKTITYYSNFDNNHDILSPFKTFGTEYVDPFPQYAPVTSLSDKRGRIDSILYFNKNNEKIKSIEYEYYPYSTTYYYDFFYNMSPEPNFKPTICVAKGINYQFYTSTQALPQVKGIFRSDYYSYYFINNDPCIITSEKTTDYFNGQSIENTTQYIYSADGYFNLKEQKTINSNSQSKIIKFSYPVDYANQEPFKSMIQNNIISPIVTKQEFMGTKKTKEIQVEFYDASNFFLPKLEKEWNTDNTYRTSFNFDTYDSKGNLTQYHTKSDLYTTLLYGYNNSLPVAKIENCKVTDISPSSLITEVGSSYSNSEIKTKLDVIKSSKTDAYITSCVYNADNKTPVEIKSPADISTYYNYDGWNRLHTVKNNDVKTTVQYKYNLTETIPVSQLSCPENSNSEPNIDEEYYYIDYELTQAPNTITICKITEDDVPFNEYESLKDGKTYKVNFNHNLNEPYYLDLYFGAEYMGEKQEDTQINLTEHYASYNSGYYMFTTNDITCWKINQKMNYFIQKYGTKKELDYFLIIKAVTSSGEMISESDRLPFTPQVCN